MVESVIEKIKEKIQRSKEFIRRLQRLEDKEKKRWLIGSTAIAMILFFSLWITYIDFVGLPTIAVKTKIIATTTEPAVAQEESFIKIFQRGWKEISGQINNNITKTKELINEQVAKTNEIDFNNNTASTTDIPTTTILLENLIATSTQN
ncbi:MAG: hypothetical protein Q8L36_01075 [bacterium]|nr:hypothetical protein [bacterium]